VGLAPHASTRPSGADVFETPEYDRNYGLSEIKASSAYALGATGAIGGTPIKIATLDSGVDLAHPDLAGQIDPASTDIVAGRGGSAQDLGGHGTSVAGVLVAARNGIGMHGVAFDSRVLAVRADSSCTPRCTFLYSDLAHALDYAVAHGARIINMSFGSPGTAGAEFETAYRNAINAGVIIVAAAGNDGGPDPEYPARYAASADAKGQAVAVGAVDAANQPASFTNLAGDTAAKYLMAPGVDITTTALGGGTAVVSGTSFAAPHVAGAAALVLSQSPFLSPKQVVDILLASAARMGDPSHYGQGLVDLQAALNPIGPLSVPLGASVEAPAAELSTTALRLGSAFGDALRGRSGPGAVMVLDSYKRAYIADLAPAIARTATRPDIGTLLSTRNDGRLLQRAFGTTVAVAMSLTPEREDYELRLAPDEGQRVDRLQLVTALGSGRRLAFSRGVPATYEFGLPLVAGDAVAGLLAPGAFESPYLGLVRAPDSVVLGQAVAGLEFRFGFADDGEDQRSSLLAEFGKSWADGSHMAVQWGELTEQDGLLAARGDGGFDFGAGATTQFVGISGAYAMGPHLRVLANYSAGWTTTGPQQGLLRDFSQIRSSAYGVGICLEEAVRPGDRLGFSVSRPLRVDSGSATLSLPVARSIDGAVIRANRRVGLTPSGAELDAELSYQLPAGNDGALAFNLLLRLEPGHVRDADPAGIAAMRYRIGF
jgi:hypothetical protein